MTSDSHNVVLSVSGLLLSLNRKQINKYPNTRLAQLFLHSKSASTNAHSLASSTIVEHGGHGGDTTGSVRNNRKQNNNNVVVYFFNRNPLLFVHIVDFYRTGMLHFPHHYCWTAVSEELDYWRIDRSYLADCCRKIYHDHKRRVESFRDIQRIFGDDIRQLQSAAIMNAETATRFSRFQNTLAQFYHQSTTSKTLKVKCYYFFYITVVILYLLSYIMQSEPDFREVLSDSEGLCPEYKQWSNSSMSSSTVWQSKTNATPSAGKIIPKYIKYFISAPNTAFLVIDGFCNAVFFVDLILRYMGSLNIRTFFTTSGHLTDCICNACDICSFLIHVLNRSSCNMGVLVIYLLLEVSRVIRVMRLIQFTNRYNSIIVLILTLRSSMRELLLLLWVLGAGVVVFGFLIYVAELGDSQISRVDHILIGFWWSISTMTTLGYGEITPTTPAGYLIGSACAITGVIFVALQVPVIANKFNKLYAYACDQQLREQWTNEHAMSNGEETIILPAITRRQSFASGIIHKSAHDFDMLRNENPIVEFKRQLQRIPTYYTPSSLTLFSKQEDTKQIRLSPVK